MSEIFQHLKPAEPAPMNSAAGVQLARLEDMDRHLGSQAAMRVITDPVTNRKVLAVHTLPGAAADVAPYDRDYPSGMTGVAGMSESAITARTSAVLGRLDESLEVPNVLPVNRVAVGAAYQQTLVLGHAAGVSNLAPFSVSHLGGEKWRVAAGSISGGGVTSNTRTVEGADLRIAEGWLGFWVTLTPFFDESLNPSAFVYRIDPEGMSAESSYQNSPPKRTYPAIGEQATWQSGRMFVPLAFVRAASRILIIPDKAGNNLTFPAEYTVGLPTIA